MPVHHESSSGREVVAVAEGLEEVEGDQEVGRPRGDQGTELPVNADMALHRPAALCHAVGLGAPDAPVFDDARLTEDV